MKNDRQIREERKENRDAANQETARRKALQNEYDKYHRLHVNLSFYNNIDYTIWDCETNIARLNAIEDMVRENQDTMQQYAGYILRQCEWMKLMLSGVLDSAKYTRENLLRVQSNVDARLKLLYEELYGERK